MGPLSNPVPSSYRPAYEPDEPGRNYFDDDPPVMRPSDGSAAKDAVARHLDSKSAKRSKAGSK